MRTFAIGDIHGCSVALRALIEYIGLEEEDTLITLGDYVDRGPDSRGVVQQLIDLKKRCNLVTLKGNHEQIMELSHQSRFDRLMWNNVGGGSTIISYEVDCPNDFPPEHRDFFENCQLYYETPTHIFVHGGLQPDFDMEDQDEDDLLWLRIDDLQAHYSGKIIVCGHTPQRNHKVLDLGYALCIDTHVFSGGWLTCLEVETGKYWQANELGERRECRIESSDS